MVGALGWHSLAGWPDLHPSGALRVETVQVVQAALPNVDAAPSAEDIDAGTDRRCGMGVAQAGRRALGLQAWGFERC